MLKKVNNNAFRLDLLEDYKVNTAFNVTDLIHFVGGTNEESDLSYLRSNIFQEGWDDVIPLAKGPTTKSITKRIQEN